MLLNVFIGPNANFRAPYLAAPHLATPRDVQRSTLATTAWLIFFVLLQHRLPLRRPSGRRSLLHSKVALAKMSRPVIESTRDFCLSQVLCACRFASSDVNPKGCGYCELCSAF